MLKQRFIEAPTIQKAIYNILNGSFTQKLSGSALFLLRFNNMELNAYYATVEKLCMLNGKLEAIIESSSNAIFELDSEGNFVLANPAFSELFHKRVFDADAPHYSNFFDNDELVEVINTVHSGDREFIFKETHLDLAKPDGGLENKFIEGKFFKVPMPGSDHVVGVLVDKSDVMRAIWNREQYITTLLHLVEDLRIDNRETIYHLASLVEIRDNITGKHLQRIEALTRTLATEYVRRFHQRDKRLSEEFAEDMAISSILHDIGKVGVSDAVLMKPGKLSKTEFETMKQHTLIAGEALRSFKGGKDFLSMGREIALSHHEKWNGYGYPQGLKGEQIPLSARVVSLCDTYDALVNKRPYKDAFSHEEAVRIISAERDISFDPEIVDLFLENQETFRVIAESIVEID
jgi:HD-GYP domain-containing protein (c-di-GMP phosphodiesterase class II)